MSADFNSEVLAWGKLALDQDPFLDFDGLVRALPGVHPSDVARLLGSSLPTFEGEAAQKADISYINSIGSLPVPHPLDYDWRFSSATAIVLSECASLLTPHEGSIALFGAPSLFENLRQSRPDTILLLADASAESVAALSSKFGSQHFVICDLLAASLPEMTADVVVADPPWYPEFFKAFIWAAARIVRVGGSLLLCGPNHGTRPGAKQEWEQIEQYAQSLGFELCQFESQLRYDTPPFERNAMTAAGHPLVSSDWRSGCLATFARRRMTSVGRTALGFDASIWKNFSVGGVRLRIRSKPKQNALCPVLRELVPGDVLDSVSRRDIRRSGADLWTSGNRIFGCADTYALGLIAQALAAGASSVTFIEVAIGRQLDRTEKDAIEASERRLKIIIEVEQDEYLCSSEDLSVS